MQITPSFFFFIFAKKIDECKESFGKRLRGHAFPDSETYYHTDVAKRLKVEFCP